MKKEFIKQNLNKILVILVIITISLISFIGIYSKEDGKFKNILPDYTLGMNLKGHRTIKLSVDERTNEVIKDKDGNIIESASDEEIEQNGYTKEEVPTNSPDVLNEENYRKTKKIIEERLEELEVSGYELRLDEKTGKMVLNLVEDENTDYMISGVVGKGTFEIKDEETGEVLIGKEHIRKATITYSNPSNYRTSVYLNIIFDKEGKEKLAEISETYVSSTSEDGTEVEKKVGIYVDDTSILSSTFNEKITNGQISLTIGSSSGTNTRTMTSAKITAAEINTDTMPIEYTADESNYIQITIPQNTQKILLGIAIAAMIIISVILMIRYKKGLKGLLAAISYIGETAVFLLVLRLTKVEISIEGIFAIIAIQIINYILIEMILKNTEKNDNKKEIDNTIIKFFLRIIPLYVISVVFTFISYLPIYSFGMVMFWGLSVILLYNMLFSKILLTNNK